MPPSTVAKSGFLGMVGGTIVVPELPICNGKTFDFYIVTNNFAHAVAGVQRIEGVGMSPHFPVRLLLRGDARRFTVRTLVRPKRVPPILMHGPQPKPPSYHRISECAKSIPIRLDSTVSNSAAKDKMSAATHDFVKLARSKFDTISQDNFVFRETHFARRPTAAAAATIRSWILSATRPLSASTGSRPRTSRFTSSSRPLTLRPL